jgi:hypothetical protein
MNRHGRRPSLAVRVLWALASLVLVSNTPPRAVVIAGCS